MENTISLWSYQEIIEEMKQKLMYTSIELESVKAEAIKEMKKHMEYEKQVLQLLKIAMQERDEARDQLYKLLNKFMLPEVLPNLPQLSPQSTLIKPTRTNSNSTDQSNSLTEPYSYHSQHSSPVESFFDPVSSPDLLNISNHPIGDLSNSMALGNESVIQDYNGTVSTSLVSLGALRTDQDSLIIDNLARGLSLPEKGKLFQSVLEAGPLIQTLLLSAPLPKWRNPPPPQPFHSTPVSIKGCDVENVSPRLSGNASHVIKPLNSQPCMEMSYGSPQIISNSILNFGNGALGSCVGNDKVMPSAGVMSSFAPTGKRQRLHHD